MLPEWVIVSYIFKAVLIPVEPERVLPMDAVWQHVPVGWEELSVHVEHMELACLEHSTELTCFFARMEHPEAGLELTIRPGTRLALIGCRGGARTAVVRRSLLIGPPLAKHYAVVVQKPTPGRCWWDLWCALGR